MDPNRQRLAELISATGRSYAFFSKLIGRNSAYIQQYLTRGSPKSLSESDALALAHYFDVPVEELIGPTKLEVRDAKVIFVPILGNDQSEHSMLHWNVDAQWLSQISARAFSVFAYPVEGDVMSPTVSAGDMLLCDRHHNASLLRDGLYVLQICDRIEARRVCVEPRRKLISLKADNQLYPTFHGLTRKSLTILGRAIAVVKVSNL